SSSAATTPGTTSTTISISTTEQETSTPEVSTVVITESTSAATSPSTASSTISTSTTEQETTTPEVSTVVITESTSAATSPSTASSNVATSTTEQETSTPEVSTVVITESTSAATSPSTASSTISTSTTEQETSTPEVSTVVITESTSAATSASTASSTVAPSTTEEETTTPELSTVEITESTFAPTSPSTSSSSVLTSTTEGQSSTSEGSATPEADESTVSPNSSIGTTLSASTEKTTPLLPESTTVGTSGEYPSCANINTSEPVYLPHPKVCSKYYECYNGVLILRKCPNGLHFNPSTRACDYPQNAGCLKETTIATEPTSLVTSATPVSSEKTSVSTTPTSRPTTSKITSVVPSECPATNGKYAVHISHESNCSLFYTCDYGRKILQRCPPGLRFNPFKQVCDWPRNIKRPKQSPVISGVQRDLEIPSPSLSRKKETPRRFSQPRSDRIFKQHMKGIMRIRAGERKKAKLFTRVRLSSSSGSRKEANDSRSSAGEDEAHAVSQGEEKSDNRLCIMAKDILSIYLSSLDKIHKA
ncbi:hypothetical protein TSAR_011004, partial [Trichomalopsis sarcophagae]